MKYGSVFVSALLACTAGACGDNQNILMPQSSISAAKGAPGGGAGGGATLPPPPSDTPVPAPSGGSQLPPPSTVDGPAWYFSEIGGIAGPLTADINFDDLQNQSAGASPIGQIRMGVAEFVYNTSKKTALTITNITIVGASASDFAVDPADLASAVTTVLPPNKHAVEVLHLTFTPSGEGLRTATLLVSSAAGVAEVSLQGTGLPNRPIVPLIAPLQFLTGSAPINLELANAGGQTLSIDTLAIGGANPEAFTFTVANHGFSNCFTPMLLGPKSECLIAVGLAPGVTTAASATLIIVTNDPLHPRQEVPITFTP